MKVPIDATLDVQASFREVIAESERLKNQWVLLNGSQLTGAKDANTATGLVTLQQLNAVESKANSDVGSILARIKQLKVDNNLV